MVECASEGRALDGTPCLPHASYRVRALREHFGQGRRQLADAYSSLGRTLHDGVGVAGTTALAGCVLAAATGWATRGDAGKHFGEGKVITLASVGVLAVSALCCLWNAARLPGGLRRAGWAILGALLGTASLDDLWKLHERMEEWLAGGRIPHGMDDLLLLWYPVGAGAAFGVLLRREIVSQPVMICRLGLAGLLFGTMVAMDALHGPAWIEDSFKLTAGAIILATVRAAGVATARAEGVSGRAPVPRAE